MPIISPSSTFPFPTLDMAIDKIQALTKSLEDVPVHYGLGAKVNPLSLQAGSFDKVDCSGFVRWCVYHATGPVNPVVIPDGSATQHEWIKNQGFKHSTYEAGLLEDNVIRIAFLSPEQTSEKIGHVLLIINGTTYESHGGVGVSSRKWGSQGFMKIMNVYVLTLHA